MKRPQSWPGTLLAILVATVLVGVSTPSYAKLPANAEIRAYLNESCVVADEPYYQPQSEDGQHDKAFALSGAIVGKFAYALLNGAFKLSAKGLGNMSSQKDMYFVSAYDFDMYRASLDESPVYGLNGQLSCVTVVAANFEPTGTDCTQRYQPRTLPAGVTESEDLESKATREDNSVENILRRANICVDGPARTVFESRISLSDDETAFRLESVGLQVNALLGTNSERAKRSMIYIVEISEPAQNSDTRTLAIASTSVGTVRPGLKFVEGNVASRSDWIKVPPMSATAYSAYQRDTAIHQDVFSEIKALERSLLRNKRLHQGLKQRVSGASEKVGNEVLQSMERLEFKILHAEALLDARKAEYQDLPRPDRYYMPVVIKVGIIESRSEKRAFSTLAAFLDKHSKTLASKATQTAGFQRSLDPLNDTDDESDLETARGIYFDALVAVEESSAVDDETSTIVADELARAKEAYNQARAAAGIPEID